MGWGGWLAPEGFPGVGLVMRGRSGRLSNMAMSAIWLMSQFLRKQRVVHLVVAYSVSKTTVRGYLHLIGNTQHGAFLDTFRFVGLYKKVLYTTV